MNLNQAKDNEKVDIDKIWKLVLSDLTHKYGQSAYDSWFAKINLSQSQPGYINLHVPTHFIRDWINSNYLGTITNLCKHYNTKIHTINILVGVSSSEKYLGNDNFSTRSPNANIANKHKASGGSEAKYYPTNNATEDDNIFAYNLEQRFTFDNFVVGTPNELAYAAARAIAESKAAVSESNPLFLYGGVGLGKTHLMHAIALYIRENNPARKVIYMSAEKFMYQFVRALRNKDIMNFKDQFRSVDLLMIDDIQFICGKDSTQEEFFHTFNAIIENNSQMVISCDRSPSDLDNIEERIKSRLGWGLVADVHTTTYELRLGILQSKVELMNLNIATNVLEFLAAKICTNVRELEGALNKVIAHTNLVGREITLESTQQILKDLLRSSEKIVTIEEIQRKIAERYNIKISDMSSASRQRSIARPRQIAMYLAKHFTTKSLADIGKKFGKKDHTTIIHAIKKVESLKLQDAEFSEELTIATKILES